MDLAALPRLWIFYLVPPPDLRFAHPWFQRRFVLTTIGYLGRLGEFRVRLRGGADNVPARAASSRRLWFAAAASLCEIVLGRHYSWAVRSESACRVDCCLW